ESGGVYASRLWWMLRWVGHTNVAVLDGGWQAWTRAKLPFTVEQPAVEPVSFSIRAQSRLAVDGASLQANLGEHSALILDARSSDRYRGENEILDPVAGHIPGAVNRFFKQNLGEDGCFKAP